MSKAQSISEYVILIGLVSLVLIGMQVYMKRGIQAVVKVAADELGRQQDAEEIDIQKGTKTDSDLTTITVGAAEDTENLPKGASRRTQVFSGGSQRNDFETTAKTTGTQTYISEKEAQ